MNPPSRPTGSRASRLGQVLLLGAAALFLVESPAAAEDPPPPGPAGVPEIPLADRVERAVLLGVGALRKLQMPAGNWDIEVLGLGDYGDGGVRTRHIGTQSEPYTAPTACTSLVLYTLLCSGVTPDDSAVVRGFEYLKRGSEKRIHAGKRVVDFRMPEGTYEIAVLLLALEAKVRAKQDPPARGPEPRLVPGPKHRLTPHKRIPPEEVEWVRQLSQSLVRRLSKPSGWRYGVPVMGTEFQNGPRALSDMSATALAASALLAAERCGVQHPGMFWADLLRWVVAMQEKDGPETARRLPPGVPDPAPADRRTDRARGWSYLGPGGNEAESKATGSMTASAMGTLAIAVSVLRAYESRSLSIELSDKADRAWWDGAAWLDRHWAVDRNPHSDSFHIYYLAALERAAGLTATDVLAGRKWHDEAARVLVDAQDPSGAWTKKDIHEPAELINTCLALQTLLRTTRPVVE